MEYAAKLKTPGGLQHGYFFTKIKPKLPTAQEAHQAYWNHLSIDNYIEGDYKFRQRKYARLEINFESQEIANLGSTYFQEEEFNELFGGQHRVFSPVDSDFLKDPFFLKLLNFDYHFFKEHKLLTGVKHYVGIHQIRTTTISKRLGEVTPEGIHKDGHPFFGIHLINRVNINGGVTTLYDNNRNLLDQITLNSFGDTLLVEDDKLFHGVSPIGSISDGLGFRDVLIIEFY